MQLIEKAPLIKPSILLSCVIIQTSDLLHLPPNVSPSTSVYPAIYVLLSISHIKNTLSNLLSISSQASITETPHSISPCEGNCERKKQRYWQDGRSAFPLSSLLDTCSASPPQYEEW
ncbi:hypothetical protein L211DRAFT_372755 [Terfezia boudieri ATCC MYA-4762]|uniref:Uncharacterized protein n=1 Tax=Terfezia boudieri ATCC MYA-4762 TaxID=1051890 RepID=A0A3N4LZD7_9PEZI|nr:hypothetical protein L211DRAFT_372755 [Terfezia boudieri ATCC MYA-4762]